MAVVELPWQGSVYTVQLWKQKYVQALRFNGIMQLIVFKRGSQHRNSADML